MNKKWIRLMIARNLRRKSISTLCLFIMTVVLTFAVYGGFILTASLRNGMNSLSERLGADLIIVPAGDDAAEQAMLLSGSRSFFYMKKGIGTQTAKVSGVNQTAEQFYLTSMSASCCSGQVQIIGFDPKTDFIIQPWISAQHAEMKKTDEIIAGSNVVLDKNNTIRIFGRNYRVTAQLAKTATGLDDSVYVTMDAIPQMIKDAEKKGFHFLNTQKQSNAVSTVFVKLSEDADRSAAESAIRKICGSEADIVESSELTGQTADHLCLMTFGIKTLMVILWGCEMVTVSAVMVFYMNRRKEEFATLRMMGVRERDLYYMVGGENLILFMSAAALGMLLAAAVFLPFGTYIGMKLQMPFLGLSLSQLIAGGAAAVLTGTATGELISVVAVRAILKKEIYRVLQEEN